MASSLSAGRVPDAAQTTGAPLRWPGTSFAARTSGLAISVGAASRYNAAWRQAGGRGSANVGDSPEEIARDVAAIGRIDAVPALLRVVCDTAGVRFGAVARVTGQTWTACAVLDRLEFGLVPGSQLQLDTTLCKEVRAVRVPIVIDEASRDPVYAAHHTPRLYGIESYISVPIVLSDGEYFGNLCAIDRLPARLSEPRIVAMFQLFAELIAVQLENDRRHEAQRSELLDARTTADLREQFIAVVGHDLRNPLSVVAMSARVLVANRDAKVSGLGATIQKSVQRMSGLIDDVLDFARGRLGGGFDAEMAPVQDLAQALHEVVEEARHAAPARALNARIAAPASMVANRQRLQQLVSNLLGNALQHGAADVPIEMDARVEGDVFVITVSNGGEPIPAGDLDKVFHPFWRTAGGQPRQGLGLGLFICAQIAKAHGGRIDVRSTRAAGTTFAVRLPVLAGAV